MTYLEAAAAEYDRWDISWDISTGQGVLSRKNEDGTFTPHSTHSYAKLDISNQERHRAALKSAIEAALVVFKSQS